MLGKSTLITFVTSLTSVLAATLSGSATITPQDYYGLRKRPNNFAKFVLIFV